MDEDDLDYETSLENKDNICQRINLINVGKVNFQIKHIKYQSLNVIKRTLIIRILEILK